MMDFQFLLCKTRARTRAFLWAVVMRVAKAIRKCPGQERLEKALAVTELFPKGSSFSDLVPKA